MKYGKEDRESDNVQLDCLGERNDVHSAQGGASSACQAEVMKLRQQTMSAGKTPAEQDQLSIEFDASMAKFINDRAAAANPMPELKGTEIEKVRQLIAWSQTSQDNLDKPGNPTEALTQFKQQLPNLLVEAHTAAVEVAKQQEGQPPQKLAGDQQESPKTERPHKP